MVAPKGPSVLGTWVLRAFLPLPANPLLSSFNTSASLSYPYSRNPSYTQSSPLAYSNMPKLHN
jgi:hypothetical protein